MFHTVPVSDDRRVQARTTIDRPAVLRIGDHVEEVEVNDLTRDGCRITASIDLEPLTRVSIGLAGVGHTPARLIWRSATHYGCAFDRPLPTGAVTASKLNNVARLDGIELPRTVISHEEVKYSYRARVAIVGGLSGLLWAAIGGLAIWLI